MGLYIRSHTDLIGLKALVATRMRRKMREQCSESLWLLSACIMVWRYTSTSRENHQDQRRRQHNPDQDPLATRNHDSLMRTLLCRILLLRMPPRELLIYGQHPPSPAQEHDRRVCVAFIHARPAAACQSARSVQVPQYL